MNESRPRPLVLTHRVQGPDIGLVGQLLDSLGIDSRPIEQVEATRLVLEPEQVDLILTDSSGGVGPLTALLALLDGRPDWADLPMVLLANPDDLPLLSELTARRFNAVLLTKPMGREQLVAVIESGLRLRARQREVQILLAEVSTSNEQLASANRALEQGREEAAEEAQRKTRFLSAISHDIRTPVNALILSCQLLRAISEVGTATATPIDAQDVDELTDALLSNASALVELVNDLLDIARHDQGKLEFTESDFPLDAFLTATIDGMRPLAEQKHLRLTLDIATPGAVLRSDRVKLARVVQNLVANAIKFTDAGEVRVAGLASTQFGATLTVQDTGVGIPDLLRAGIFDEFAQLRNPERDRTKGTGLGLAICRRLVAAMGGTIEITTQPDQVGSTFEVTLPRERVVLDGASEPAPGRSPMRSAKRFQGAVLVVEDHEPSRTLLQRLLRQTGLIVATAENGHDALHQIHHHRPDLVLMDLMMPVMGGRETLHHLRADPTSRDLKVIILTGDLEADNSPTLIEGATACLSKPVEVPLLIELLEKYLTPQPIQA